MIVQRIIIQSALTGRNGSLKATQNEGSALCAEMVRMRKRYVVILYYIVFYILASRKFRDEIFVTKIS